MNTCKLQQAADEMFAVNSQSQISSCKTQMLICACTLPSQSSLIGSARSVHHLRSPLSRDRWAVDVDDTSPSAAGRRQRRVSVRPSCRRRRGGARRCGRPLRGAGPAKCEPGGERRGAASPRRREAWRDQGRRRDVRVNVTRP